MEETQYYIQQLKLKLQNLLGRVISRNADIVELESILNSRLKTKDHLSYSTLRRFFGFIPSTKPSPKTLHSISKVLGYKDFSDFCVNYHVQGVWELIKLFDQLEEEREIGQAFQTSLKQHRNQNYYLSHFACFLSQLLKEGNLELLNLVFQENAFFSSHYFDRLRIADVLGRRARKLGEKLDQLNLLQLIYQSKIAEEIFLYLFVDYGSFNGYYGDLIQQIDLRKIAKSDDRLFIKLIKNSIRFFRKESSSKLDPQLNTKGMHPILKGRYHGQLLLLAEDKESYYNKIFSEARLSDAKQGYFFEILPIFILLKDFDSIKKVEKFYYEALLTPANWTFEDKKAFSFIAFSLLALKKGDSNSARIMLELIDLEKVFASYRLYVELLYCIPQFYLSGKAEEWRQRYLDTAQHLGFSFFSEDYLESYLD